MQEELISKATIRNWKRLKLDLTNIDTKLTSRANRLRSQKKIVPVEYFKNKKNRSFLQKITVYDDIKSVLYTVALNLLSTKNLIKITGQKITSENKYLLEILEEYKTNMLPELLDISFPKDERDILGLIYQLYLSVGLKSKTGSYYTPPKILNNIIKNLRPEDKFLDPCCGSGSFLLSASDIIQNPENIYGCDIDNNACFIAKINLILKFPDKKFRPKIFNIDFLAKKFKDLPNFDIIATNPPWGAAIEKKNFSLIKSGESFSYFIEAANNYIKSGSRMIFVLPEAILNIKAHKDIRKFILNNFHIDKIELYGKAFQGVLSDVAVLYLNKSKSEKDIIIQTKSKKMSVCQNFYEQNTNNNFSTLDNKDIEILQKIYSTPHKTLDKNSIWAIGIVTGANSKHITKNSEEGEKIYSGKNITKNAITDTDNYIIYDRDKFQQTAPDSIYRAKEKLVYKFISKKLVFAYDNQQRLFLNSANILIPKLEGYTIKEILAFLNSQLFNYIYLKKFNELKVLKGNLMELPFPQLTGARADLTDEKIFEIFGLDENEVKYIQSEVL